MNENIPKNNTNEDPFAVGKVVNIPRSDNSIQPAHIIGIHEKDGKEYINVKWIEKQQVGDGSKAEYRELLKSKSLERKAFEKWTEEQEQNRKNKHALIAKKAVDSLSQRDNEDLTQVHGAKEHKTLAERLAERQNARIAGPNAR